VLQISGSQTRYLKKEFILAISVQQGSTKNNTYTVAGDDLAAIWKDVEKKAPSINGKNAAAKTKTSFDVKIKFKMKNTPNKRDPATFDGDFWISGGSLDYHGDILMPKLKSDKALSKPAKNGMETFCWQGGLP